jgi:endonuclease YncB( thermonuclease family)
VTVPNRQRRSLLLASALGLGACAGAARLQLGAARWSGQSAAAPTRRVDLGELEPQRLAAARRWVRGEFQPSTLDESAQMAEMGFFIQAGRPFSGQRIHVASETIPTHVYEQRFLARAFFEITGIRVQHDLVHEGELVERLRQQTRTGRNLYDAYVNDSDFIGTHSRSGPSCRISDWIDGDGAAVTLPTLDLDRTSSAWTSPLARTARSTSSRISSSRTSIGSGSTGSSATISSEPSAQRYRLSARRAPELEGLRRHCRLLHQSGPEDRWAGVSGATWTMPRSTPR